MQLIYCQLLNKIKKILGVLLMGLSCISWWGWIISKWANLKEVLPNSQTNLLRSYLKRICILKIITIDCWNRSCNLKANSKQKLALILKEANNWTYSLKSNYTGVVVKPIWYQALSINTKNYRNVQYNIIPEHA
jgi:hypothetical protein